MFSPMASAALKGPDAGSIDQQVDTMLASPAAATLDQQVDAALDEAERPSANIPGPTTSAAELDSKLAKAAESTIDDEFADPVTLEPAGPAPVALTPAEAPPTPLPAVAVAAVVAAATAAPSTPTTETTAKAPAPPALAAAPTPAAPNRSIGSRIAKPLSPLFLKFSSLVEPMAMKLGGLSPSARQTVGWISLLTLFHALIVWAYVLLKSPSDAGQPSVSDPRLIVSDEHAAKVATAVAHEHAENAAHAKPADSDHAAKDAHAAPAKAPKAKPAKPKPAAKGKDKPAEGGH